MPLPKPLLITSWLLLICGCSQRADIGSEQRDLLKTDQEWAAAAAEGNPERILSFWADDAVNYFPGFPPARGKAAISELVKRNRSQSGFSLSWEPVEAVVSAGADMGYTTGPFTLSMNAPNGSSIKRTGHYVCIWKKQPDGAWKCAVESTIFDSSPHPIE